VPRSVEPRPPLDLARLELPDQISLLVAWRRGRSLESGEIRVADGVAEHLRGAARRTLERLAAAELVAYTPEIVLEPDQALYAGDGALVAESPFTAAVLPRDPPQVLNARSLPERALLLYAVNAATDQGPVAFVRKRNPHPVARPGRIYALLGNTLAAVDRPVFTLEPEFDLIVGERGVVATDQNAFELLFGDAGAVLDRIPDWVEGIAEHLPLAGAGAEVLADRARSNSSLRRRLHAIHERGHLRDVDIETVRRHIRAVGLPEGELIAGEELVVDETNPLTLLYLLNEDFFAGGLTNTGFRSERKSPRG
jgi:hypothetical protein